MSDRQSLEAASQAEPDRTFARLRNFFRLIRRPREGESLRETIDEMIEEPSTEDPHPLSTHERVLIGNILKVHGRTAADVMVPRIDIVALDVETLFPEVVKCMVEQGHSRVPVYRETLEDLIEEIVGEIEDEHDVADRPSLTERADGTLIVDARTPIEVLEERQGTRLRPTAEQEEVDTLGGLVSSLAGRVPKRGEIIAHPSGIEFEVLDADPRRIKRLRVRSPSAATSGRDAAGV